MGVLEDMIASRSGVSTDYRPAIYRLPPTVPQMFSKGLSESLIGDVWRAENWLERKLFGREIDIPIIDEAFKMHESVDPSQWDYENLGISGNIVRGAGMLAGDLPAYAATMGIVGPLIRLLKIGKWIAKPILSISKKASEAVLTVAAEKMATMGLTFSVVDATKESLREGATLGSVITHGVQGGILGTAMMGAGLGAGRLTATSGRVLRYGTPAAAEIGILTGLPAAFEGRKPTVDELVVNAALLGGLKVTHGAMRVSSGLAYDEIVGTTERWLRSGEVWELKGLKPPKDGRFPSSAELAKASEADIDFRSITPEGMGQLRDRVMYQVARRIAPKYAKAYGIMRGVLDAGELKDVRFLYPTKIAKVFRYLPRLKKPDGTDMTIRQSREAYRQMFFGEHIVPKRKGRRFIIAEERGEPGDLGLPREDTYGQRAGNPLKTTDGDVVLYYPVAEGALAGERARGRPQRDAFFLDPERASAYGRQYYGASKVMEMVVDRAYFRDKVYYYIPESGSIRFFRRVEPTRAQRDRRETLTRITEEVQPPLLEDYRRAIVPKKALKGWRVKGEEIWGRIERQRKIFSIAELKKKTLPQLRRIHQEIVKHLKETGRFEDIKEEMRDPWGIIDQFWFWPKGGPKEHGPKLDIVEVDLAKAIAQREMRLSRGEGKRSPAIVALNKDIKEMEKYVKDVTSGNKDWLPRLKTLIPPEEEIRMQIIPEVRIMPYGFRSPRYSLDGTYIVPDVDEAYHKYMAEIHEWTSKMEKATKGQKINGENVKAYAKAEMDFNRLPSEIKDSITKAEMDLTKVLREMYDSFVDPNRIDRPMSLYLITPSGRIRKYTDFLTAMKKTVPKMEARLHEEVKRETPRPMAKKRRPETEPSENVIEMGRLYLNYASRAIFLDPAVARGLARAGYLPKLKKNYAEEYIKTIKDVRKRLHPTYIDRVSRIIAGRYYVGALGLSPGSPLRNFTQLWPTAVEIGVGWLTRGIKRFATDPKMRQLAEEAGVRDYFVPEYREYMGQYRDKFHRFMDWVDEKALWMFGASETFMRQSTFIGGYLKAMKYGEKLNVKGLREDTISLMKKHWADKNYEEAAKVYGKESSLKVHYGYSKVQGMPALKTPLGRTAFQFWSYPSYTVEMWIEAAMKGGGKKVGAMILGHPLMMAAGHPLGIAMTGFLGWGILPHLAPFVQFMKSLGGIINSDTQVERDKHLRDFRMSAYMLAPGGRMVFTKMMTFAESASNNWKRINPITGKVEQETAGMAFLRLADLFPAAAEKEYKYRQKLYEMKSDRNYIRGKAYKKLWESIQLNQAGDNEKATILQQEAMADFLVTGGMPRSGDIRRWMQFESQPQLMESLLRDKKMMYHFLYSVSPVKRQEIMDIIDSRRVDMWSTK